MLSADRDGAWHHLLVLALVAGMLSVSTVAQAQTAEERRLEETEARLGDVRDQLEAAEAEAAADATALTDADAQLDAIMDAVAATQSAVARQHRSVEAARQRAEDSAAAAQRARAQATERLVAAYRRGASSDWQLLLLAPDSGSLVDRAQLTSFLARGDLRVREAASVAGTRAQADHALLAAEERALERVLAQQQGIEADVALLREDRRIQLAASRAGVDDLRQQEQLLESDSRQLAAVIERTAAVAAASRQREPRPDAPSAAVGAAPPPVATSAAGWGWPVRGTVTSEFGPRWGQPHEGIDIAAPTGTPLVASRAGTVTFAGSMGGYGLVTIVDHGDGFTTVYAHQSRLVAAAGQRVAGGEQIGAIGCSGRCTGPHTHFEVRAGNVPRNPRGYLP